MAIKKKISQEELQKFLNPESFESKHKAIFEPKEKMQINVTLDQLMPYDYNPRQKQNSKYDEIKDSILNRGLDHMPNVTKRPGSDLFMIKDGGNTRLEILNDIVKDIDIQIALTHQENEENKELILLELHKKRSQFFEHKCNFTPWNENESEVESEIELLAGHMVENELRSDMIFIERALATVRFRNLFEEQENRKLSGRELAKKIKEKGWSANDGAISRYEYAVNELLDLIPTALWQGMGFSVVKNIRQYQNAVEQLWIYAETESKTSDHGWRVIWETVLRESDDELFSIADLSDKIEARIAKALSSTPNTIQAELCRLINEKGADPVDSLLNRKASNITPFVNPAKQLNKVKNSQVANTETPVLNDTVDTDSDPQEMGRVNNGGLLVNKIKRLSEKHVDRNYADNISNEGYESDLQKFEDTSNASRSLEDLYEENFQIANEIIQHFKLDKKEFELFKYDSNDSNDSDGVADTFEYAPHIGFLIKSIPRNHNLTMNVDTSRIESCIEDYIVLQLSKYSFGHISSKMMCNNETTYFANMTDLIGYPKHQNENLAINFVLMTMHMPHLLMSNYPVVMEKLHQLERNALVIYQIYKQENGHKVNVWGDIYE